MVSPLRTDQKEPKLLVRQGSCVRVPAGPRHSWWCWNRCCVLLTSDPKILGMLGHLGCGESSGDPGTVRKVHAQDSPGLAPTGRLKVVFKTYQYKVTNLTLKTQAVEASGSCIPYYEPSTVWMACHPFSTTSMLRVAHTAFLPPVNTGYTENRYLELMFP